MSVITGRRGRVRLQYGRLRTGPTPRPGPRLDGTNPRAKLASPRIVARTMRPENWLHSYMGPLAFSNLERMSARKWFVDQRRADAAAAAVDALIDATPAPARLTAAEVEAGKAGVASLRAELDEPP